MNSVSSSSSSSSRRRRRSIKRTPLSWIRTSACSNSLPVIVQHKTAPAEEALLADEGGFCVSDSDASREEETTGRGREEAGVEGLEGGEREGGEERGRGGGGGGRGRNESGKEREEDICNEGREIG